MAKNKIKRCLTAIYDPYPSKRVVDQLWEYFNSHCIYCEKSITRSTRTGHLDHLLAAAEGGNNGIHNFALSCAQCNGDEKREENWLDFLERKAPSPESYQLSKEKLEQWTSMAQRIPLSPDQTQQAEEIINNALLSFDQAVKDMRTLRDKSANFSSEIAPNQHF